MQAEGRKASGAVERMPSLFWPRPTPHGVGLVREDHAQAAPAKQRQPAARLDGGLSSPARTDHEGSAGVNSVAVLAQCVVDPVHV